MKPAILFLLCAVLFTACKRDDDDDPQPGSSLPVYADVPNWQTVPMLADMAGGGADTVYAFTEQTRTYIRYKGVVYQLKARTDLPQYPVSAGAHTFYVTVYSASGLVTITDCFVSSGKYFRNGSPVLQTQSFRPDQMGPWVNRRTTEYFSR
jgi:hypothetical protein